MKKIIGIILIIMIFTSMSFAAPIKGTLIKDQILTYSAGHYLESEPLTLGYDIYGYNYQAHIFNGYYCNIYLGTAGFPPYTGDGDAYLDVNPDAANHWAWPYHDEKIIMKWNDAWLSKMDRDDDGKLDRHYGFESYIDSGAWETNHNYWTDEDGDHEYFIKIIAVRSSDVLEDGIWYTEEGHEIGPVIWGQFAIIQEEEDGETVYVSPYKTGLGFW